MGARLEDLLEAAAAAGSRTVGVRCARVMSSTTATPPATPSLSLRRRLHAQRPDVDHQAVLLLAVQISRERVSPSSAERNSGLEQLPQLGRERVADELALAARRGVAQALDRLARRQHEAQVAVEGQDQRLRQLAQRRRGRVIGAGQRRVVEMHAAPRWDRHAKASADRARLLDS